MPIDASSLGTTSQPRSRFWKDRDTLLYAIGVGAGADDLAFVTENSHNVPQRVVPSFAVVACDPNGMLAKAGEIDLAKLLHGAQSIRLHRPLPASGQLEVTSEITAIHDKGQGKNAIIVMTARGRSPEDGELVVETASTVVVRGGGGFGGAPGASTPRVDYPERGADHEVTYTTRPDQALLYRLSGDRNPLHSDPWFARSKAGFDGPILHGLCTYGFACRALLSSLCDDLPERFGSMDARFVSPVFPGDELSTSIWRTSDGEAVFHTRARTGTDDWRVVLDEGRAEYRAA